jgi:hypothetical protein
MNNLLSGFRFQVSKKMPKGFTLLLAVLVSSILIALGSAIFDIISKEIVLSSSGRESQFAFFAADTGVECALYWDIKHDAFSTTSIGVINEVECAGAPRTLTRDLQNPGGPSETLVTTYTFPLGSGAESDPCSSVRVTRSHYPIETVIESAGYNTCVADDALRLERAIRVTY